MAELGYGDAPGRPERTTVGFGGSPNAKFATTYFRKSFNVANPAAFTGLTLNVLADDHFIVYFNGTEVFRDMTNAVITFATYETPAVAHDGAQYVSTNLAVSALLAGANTVAVEIHQDSATSSDISFDLMLWGLAPGCPRPRVAVDAGTGQVTISWTGVATLEETDALADLPANTVWVPSARVNGVPFTPPGTKKFYRLRCP